MTGLLHRLWSGERPSDLSIRDCYIRILAQPEDGYRRTSRRCYEGDPTTTHQWPSASYHYHTTARLVAHDERWEPHKRSL